MAENDEILMQTLFHQATQSLVLGTVLAIINQEIPDFKNRALAVLANAATQRHAAFASSLDAQEILATAVAIFQGLD